ncbi:MAG: PAS domain-containing protein [Pseudomonadota bacterium]
MNDLWKSPQELRLTVASIPGLVFTCDPAGRAEFVNEQVLDYFGRTLAELRPWPNDDVVHPDDRERVALAWQEHLALRKAYSSEHRLRRADGVYRWFQLRASPSFDGDGRLLRWFAVLTDIDELKLARDSAASAQLAEEAARLSEHNLRLLVDGIPGLVYTMTPDCKLGLVNRQLLEYFGRTYEDLQHWDSIGCVHPEDLPRVLESLRRTVEHGVPHEMEQRLRRADGVYRWFKPRGVPERDADGRILRWYCLLNDIDDLKRAEESQRNLQARLSRASQHATISELAASIAHEVNQPLTTVVAYGEACHGWLSATPPDIQGALRCVERIIRDGSSAADVISRVSSLFRQAPPIKQPLDLNEVVEEVRHLIADDLRDRSVLVKVDLQPNLPLLAADRVQMQQVLVNLTRNGIEAMDGLDIEARQLSISSRELNGEVLIQVSDVGTGIQNPGAVFEPFYTTKASGMGMGLAICKSILEAHGGRLWASPNATVGATFGFALPLPSSVLAP